MNKTDKYDFISNVISLINSTEFDSSITSLSKACNVPLPFMRNTFITLLNNKTIQSCISTDDYYDNNDDTDFDILEAFLDDPATYGARILSGEYDEVNWIIDLKFFNRNDEELLPLTSLELGSLKTFGEDTISLKRASVFEKKEITAPVPSTVRENQKRIAEAIELKKCISFDYRNKDGEIIQYTVFPVYISTNLTDNWIYIHSSDEKSYRLDRFTRPCKIVNEPVSVNNYSNNPNQKYIWGANSYNEPTPTHVKIRIFNETSNILEKIKHDTAFRKETGNLYQENDRFYYEDDIIGIKDFQRWIRGYGSSIVVLEPEELRNDIVTRAKEALFRYKVSKEWRL